MFHADIVVQPSLFPDGELTSISATFSRNLRTLWQSPDRLPASIAQSPTAMRILDLIGPLHWGDLPERNLHRFYGQPTVSNAAFIAAQLIMLNEGPWDSNRLRRFMIEHPCFIPLLGFAPLAAVDLGTGFRPASCLPTARHFTRMLRSLPNAVLQFLLADTVRLITDRLCSLGLPPIDCVSLDTKHIVAFVKENNRKACIPDRFNPARQPVGDADCRLGCKRRRNQAPPDTPTRNPVSPKRHSIGEFYWGYASGIVAAAVPALGEFVIAELTQPFDKPDVSYFAPLMLQAEQRLGYRPRFGAFDAAFDAWYVYAHFAAENKPFAPADGFAAVPFSERGGVKITHRQFSPQGLPICAAGFPMPLKTAFIDRSSTLVEHVRGRYVCPLRFMHLASPDAPARLPSRCPIRHAHWKGGGCTVQMPTSIGARIRYTLDRDSELYKRIYAQRSADERINSQAVKLGIEHPELRNGAAIANRNTLIYILINLRFLQRLTHQPQATTQLETRNVCPA